MRVAHVVSTYPPYKGGMGNVAHELVERQRKRGHEVMVLTPGTVRPWLRYGNAALLPQLLWKVRRFEVVHLHWPFIGGAEFVLLYFFLQKVYSHVLENMRINSSRKMRGMRQQNLVVTYHMDLVGSGGLAIFFRLYQWVMVPFMLRTATFVTVASLDYAEHSRWLRGRKYLVEVPFGVDAERFVPKKFSTSSNSVHGSSRLGSNNTVYSSSESRSRSGESRSTNGAIALFVAALDRAHYFKGLDVLLLAWKELGSVRQRARLRIVGEGERRAHYERQATELGIAESVEFVGSVPWQELPAMYQSADFLVFSSIDASEAFGLVISEAAASGLPAIVSNLAGVRTLVKEGETGLVVPPSDVHALALALRKFIADPEACQASGAAARHRAEQTYSWGAAVDALEWTYRLRSNPIDKLALVIVKDRQILLARSRGHRHWFIPGGKRDFGESDHRALMREIQEGLGVQLEEASIRYYGTYTAQANDKPIGIFVRGTCYTAQFTGQPRAGNEIEAIEYLRYARKSEVGNIAKLLFDDLKQKKLIE